MLDSANSPSRETSHPPVAAASEDQLQALAEREASRRLHEVWCMPEGRFPWLTVAIVLAGVVATALSFLLREDTYDALHATGLEIWLNGKWWGVIGSVFLHGDLLHLLFNGYWIWIFGRLLERELRPIRYVALFLGTAWFSSIAEIAWSGSAGIGLSGVVYAFFGFLLVNRSRHPDFARLLTRGTVLLLLGWLVACFPITALGLLNIANAAHVGGFVIGCVAGLAMYPNVRQTSARIATASLALASLVPLFWAPWHEEWQMVRAYRALAQRDDEAVLAALAKVRAMNPASVWALSTEAALHLRRGDYPAARELLSHLAATAATPDVLNNLAWLLATCPDAQVRDGPEAIRLAQRACEGDAWRSSAYIDTLAAAHAEAGNFAEAEKWVLKALEVDDDHAAILREHLEFFRAGKPWREPAAEETD